MSIFTVFINCKTYKNLKLIFYKELLIYQNNNLIILKNKIYILSEINPLHFK